MNPWGEYTDMYIYGVPSYSWNKQNSVLQCLSYPILDWIFKGTVSRKLTPMLLYIHCWKALSLKIVRRPLKNWFIKWPVRKLHIKTSAFTAHFPLKVQGSFKVLSSACSILGKKPIRIWSLRWFFCTSFFQRKMFDKLVPGNIWLCAPDFERSLHGKGCVRFKCVHCSYNYFKVRCTTELNSLDKPCTFQGKYSNNAENFKCNL